MAKDTFWFKHDSNASRDIKLMQIKHTYDFWGLGLYWSVIEVLREQPGYAFKSTEAGLGLLCTLVMCSDIIRFTNWFNDCVRLGLFQVHEEYFMSASLVARMEIWETKKTNGSAGGRPSKTESKPKHKPDDKPNQNHKRREEKSREDKIREKKNLFVGQLAAFKERYTPEMLNAFYKYWTETTPNGIKLRWEKEKAFEIDRRLSTWANREPVKSEPINLTPTPEPF